MLNNPFERRQDVDCTVFNLGEGLDLKRFPQDHRLSAAPLAVSAGGGGMAVLFRYGVLVLFGMQPSESARFLADIADFVSDPLPEPEQESFRIRFDPGKAEGVEQGHILLRTTALQGLLIVADVLARSAELGYYEVSLREHFEHIEPLARNLQGGRIRGASGRHLLEHIGDALLIEARMTGRIEVLEKPELLWDYPEYERLYVRMEDEFELAVRHAAIDRKLGLISKTAQTLLDLQHNSRSLRVEWYIVILIVIEILLTLGDKFS